MPAHTCQICNIARAQILRPRNHARICAACFVATFEAEVAETITSNSLFRPGERVAIGASGGKDSTVLASVLKTLNDRFTWNLDLVLLSIDEGITGYRDHSLEAVKRNSAELKLPLKVVSYAELYGWSMDEVVAQVGKKGNCTYCGVFRRQALDRGAAMLGVQHVVTGHNADDVAETVLMNLLRGDLPRLRRATSIVTSTPAASVPRDRRAAGFLNVKRSKPLMYAYEKEIVLYAHHRKLDYFCTECIYSPEAFRGSARTLIKNLERIRPESILDVVRSGIDMAKLVPDGTQGSCGSAEEQSAEDDVTERGCGMANRSSGGGDMTEMQKKLDEDERAEEDGLETEIKGPKKGVVNGQRQVGNAELLSAADTPNRVLITDHDYIIQRSVNVMEAVRNRVTVPIRTKLEKKGARKQGPGAQPAKQTLGQCQRCGYLSSQTLCKACVLLEGLNKARPQTGIEFQQGAG